jgi:Uma2 family endonuclease
VEVLSVTNQMHDLQKKKIVYERCGVKEYFIVEPFSKEVISYHLEKKFYKELPKAIGKIKSKIFAKTFSF